MHPDPEVGRVGPEVGGIEPDVGGGGPEVDGVGPRVGPDVRAVAVADVLDLRRRVLRAGRPAATAVLTGDDDPTTVVLAAWAPGIRGPASTATLVVAPCPWRPGVPARRLRAMATDPGARGLGVGSAVLAEAVRRARAGGALLLWCHARVTATGFYSRAGFTVDGEPFEVPGIGPHLRMELDLREG